MLTLFADDKQALIYIAIMRREDRKNKFDFDVNHPRLRMSRGFTRLKKYESKKRI